MTASDEGFGQRVLASQKALADEVSERRLRIAVLGPNLEEIGNIGTRKRYQIADALKDDGHEPFFPEQHPLMDDPPSFWLDQERQLLGDSSVDFVIILHTDGSAGGLSGGALMEIANFVSVPAIRFKTGILFPSKFYNPSQSLPGNTVQAYTKKMLYREDDMESCELVAECRRWADTRLKDLSPDLQSEAF